MALNFAAKPPILLQEGRWLLAAGCWRLAGGGWLWGLAVGCWPLAVGRWLLAAGRWLWGLAVGCWLWGLAVLMTGENLIIEKRPPMTTLQDYHSTEWGEKGESLLEDLFRKQGKLKSAGWKGKAVLSLEAKAG